MSTPTEHRPRRARAWWAAGLATALVAAGASRRSPPPRAPRRSTSRRARPPSASSAENPDLRRLARPSTATPAPAGAAPFADPQWLQVDLGATATIDHVVLQLGGRLRQGVPDPDLGRRHDVDDGRHRHQRHRRHPDPRTSPAPAATCGSTAPPAAPATATRCGSSRCSAPAAPRRRPPRPKPLPPAPAGRRHVDHPPRVPGELRADRTTCRTTRSSSRARPGASHMHTFMGNTHHQRAARRPPRCWPRHDVSCTVPQDKSAYWFPTLLQRHQVVADRRADHLLQVRHPRLQQVQPFPPGLRFVVGSTTATLDEFQNAPGTVEGFECGDSSRSWDIPADLPGGQRSSTSATRPRAAGTASTWTRPTTRATWRTRSTVSARRATRSRVPMIEFKIAVAGRAATCRTCAFSSGRGYSFHYDFFNALGRRRRSRP